jgi:ectoine hydroxylase-related dioxygenase (phytanoyl-CoA dioxygenase family)
MGMPYEFTPEGVEAASVEPYAPYLAFHRSGEPYRSMLKHNPWMHPPKPGAELEWGQGWYYDTTVARKHPYWKDVPLPQATKDLDRLRRDFHAWGYCLVEDGVSESQCKALHQRVSEQAAAERALGIAHMSPAQQHVWALVNKAPQVVKCMEHDPEAVQAGPVIERLLDETLGEGWNHLSFISNISYPGCHPQGLHHDQSVMAPYFTPEAPALINTIYILQDVDEVNGGTLVIPGSHRPNGTDGDYYGKLPPPINLEARAGTILMLDGRCLHGGAVNRSNHLRYILTNSVIRPWIRQQEAFHLTISPEVLENASDKFLMRCGFQATSTRSMVEGYGYTGTGKAGDANGAIVHARRAMDRGEYRYVGALTPDDVARLNPTDFTLGRIQAEHETYRNERYRAQMRAVG